MFPQMHAVRILYPERSRTPIPAVNNQTRSVRPLLAFLLDYTAAMSRSLATDLVQPVCTSVTLKVKDEPLFDGPDHGYDRIESVFDLGIEI